MKRKSLLMFVAMLLIFGASARGEKYSNGSYWFDLQKQDVSADEMQQVKARQNAVQNTAADWTEITLPYNVSLAFINGVSINTWGGRAMYFKFTLAQAEIVGFTASTWEPYFEIYKDEAMTNKLLQGSSTYPVLQAGTYYVAVSANENVTAQIAIQNLQLQSVTLSYDGNFSMTSATPLINGGASLAYVFETTAGQLVDFTVTAGQEVTFNLADETGSLVNVTNASYLLGKGKHYVFVRSAYVLGDGETLSGNMKIAPNAYIISELEPLPYQAEFSLTQDNTVRCLDREVQIYSFTLTNVRPARVSWQLDNNSAPAQFYFWDDNGKSLRYSSSSPLYSSSSLPAGKYYMMISDYSEAISKGNTISGNLNLEMLKIYVDWDYFEQLTPEHQILGNNNSMSPAVVQKGTDAIMGRGFNFNAEAGKIYDLKWNAYISDAMNTWMTGISTLKNTFTDDYDVDRIMAYSGMYYNTDSGQGSIFFPAKETTTVNGVFVYPKTTEPMPSDKIYFDLSIKEVPATFTEPTSGATGFTWDEITLPLVANLSFDPSLPGVDSIKPNYNFEIARGFKLTLTERTEVTYTYGVDPVALNNFALYVYTDESLTECVSPNYSCRLDPENKVILNPGTYYVVVTDGGVRSWSGKILSGPFVIKGTTNFTEESVITIQELLDSNIPTIPYTNDLAYSKSTYYINGLSATVKGESGLFQWNGSNYYAAAYKLTGMNVNDSVNIVEYSNPRNEGIYIYKKAEDGTVTRVAYDESSTWLTDSDWSNKISLKFTANAASDYYVVVSPASDKKYIPLKTAYNTIIWTEGEEPQPQAPQLPDEMKIVSTQASESQITVPENATEEQIRQALIALGITGTNALNETVNIKNNPYIWAISADGTSATCTKLVMPYTTADTYTGAVVLINYETGLSEINAVEVKLAPNPAKDFITILGLKGGETVRIFDITGRLVLVEKTKSANQPISIAGLQEGIYPVQISGNAKPQLLIVRK